ncbi:hypothetical protein CC86DRAFT_297184 [Ophiobolus disseminans]|uniref:gamma-glutamylcyclotransferase n=1 Tax=Ophiobolus disseminans TaxID=1469910 RepID=A0A6A6ZUS5_9PLEO|nr:hypothetical protein CC86DRAFT_297184 [Ophiobolus disseminans]
MSSSNDPNSKPTIYFGYGSNLWLSQMSQRCPTATYLGIARLENYTWIINDRGYANVVENRNTTSTSTGAADQDQDQAESNTPGVYGLVYALQAEDEERLDKNEGVPIAYTKEHLNCDFWSAGPASPPLNSHKSINTTKPPTYARDMLVYIDRRRVEPDVPRKEYVYRMNRGVDDALKLGVPKEYVEKVMRPYIPAEEGDGEEEVGTFARAQARGFRDESGVF